MGGTRKNWGDDGGLPPVAALVRRPAFEVRRRILDALREAGFDDVLPAHLGVFQYPGPDGQRPGMLALRTQSSKQAMNHLLHQLESQGYLVRESHPHDRRTRLVRLTDRGWAAADVIKRAVEEIEHEWSGQLGASAYGELRRSLADLDEHLDNPAVS